MGVLSVDVTTSDLVTHVCQLENIKTLRWDANDNTAGTVVLAESVEGAAIDSLVTLYGAVRLRVSPEDLFKYAPQAIKTDNIEIGLKAGASSDPLLSCIEHDYPKNSRELTSSLFLTWYNYRKKHCFKKQLLTIEDIFILNIFQALSNLGNGTDDEKLRNISKWASDLCKLDKVKRNNEDVEKD